VTLLTIEQVRARVPVARPTIYALIRRADFPKGAKQPGKGPRAWWSAAEVEAWALANGYEVKA